TSPYYYPPLHGNVETKAKVIDKNDGLIVDKDKVDRSKETGLVDRCGKDFKARQEASRNSREEPPLKKRRQRRKIVIRMMRPRKESEG
ncbi:hypothetical protein MKW98_004312, partial [Papaver atlanticum]